MFHSRKNKQSLSRLCGIVPCFPNILRVQTQIISSSPNLALRKTNNQDSLTYIPEFFRGEIQILVSLRSWTPNGWCYSLIHVMWLHTTQFPTTCRWLSVSELVVILSSAFEHNQKCPAEFLSEALRVKVANHRTNSHHGWNIDCFSNSLWMGNNGQPRDLRNWPLNTGSLKYLRLVFTSDGIGVVIRSVELVI